MSTTRGGPRTVNDQDWTRGVTNGVWFQTKRARSGFYGDEPLLWGERRETGWGVFFNREGVVSAWAGRHDHACRFSIEATFDRSTVLTSRPGFILHLWCWRYHAALFVGARGRGVALSRKHFRRARCEGAVAVDSSRSTPSSSP